MLSKTFVIGDIHNAAKALRQVVIKAKVESEDTIIFLGDYFDGWSEAKETFNLLMELKAFCNCIFIQGNHDEMVLRWLTGVADADELKMWFKHGGKATYNSFTKWFEIDPTAKENVISFLKTLKPYHIDNQERLFVHAGFEHRDGAAAQHKMIPDALWWTTDFTEGCFYGYQVWLDRSYLYKEVYVGHVPTLRLIEDCTIPIHRDNVIWMDTAAAFTGKLSLINIESKEFYQSDYCMKLYPDELGRNGYSYNQTIKR
jgi:serine/threonine protein phosphatase 1